MPRTVRPCGGPYGCGGGRTCSGTQNPRLVARLAVVGFEVHDPIDDGEAYALRRRAEVIEAMTSTVPAELPSLCQRS
jgi:hypothetical protein